MRLGSPGWLAAGVVLWLAWFWACRRADARRRAALTSLAGDPGKPSADINASRRRRRWGRRWQGATLALLCLALAGPQRFQRAEPMELQGVPYLIALDASRSMLARDVPPSRWAAATNAIDQFLSAKTGDRVGLITFAGVGYLNAPLTFDTLAIRSMLRYLDPNSVEDAGSSLSSAIDRAGRYFLSNHVDHPLLIVVSDGEDLAGSPLETTRQWRRQTGMRLCAIGVGTSTGARVPLDRAGRAAKNAVGQDVVTRLNEGNLERLAAAGGGRYFRLGQKGGGFDALRREVLAPMTESAARADLRNYIPLFWPLAALALLCAGAEAVVGAERWRRGRRPAPIKSDASAATTS